MISPHCTVHDSTIFQVLAARPVLTLSWYPHRGVRTAPPPAPPSWATSHGSKTRTSLLPCVARPTGDHTPWAGTSLPIEVARICRLSSGITCVDPSGILERVPFSGDSTVDPSKAAGSSFLEAKKSKPRVHGAPSPVGRVKQGSEVALASFPSGMIHEKGMSGRKSWFSDLSCLGLERTQERPDTVP